MDKLPEEILVDIFDYLDAEELISIQRTCTVFSKLARANTLWRYKCFEKSPSASMRRGNGNSIVNTLTNALQGLTLSERPHQPRVSASKRAGGSDSERVAESARARAINQWDLSGKDEKVDWYSEYKARYAPLSTEWFSDAATDPVEVNGISSLPGTDRVVCYLDDASVCVWDLAHTVSGRRKFRELGRSKPNVLLADAHGGGDNLIVDCVSASLPQQRAYVAVGSILNEIDLATLNVVSHSKYPFPITALSQPGSLELPLTVGTQWSLHVLDPRIPTISSSPSSHERIDEIPATPGSSTAILDDLSGGPATLPALFGVTQAAVSSAYIPPTGVLSSSPSWQPSHRLQHPQWMGYAKVEPGPLSIMHHADHEILICGRFPSILSYDRRYFPRLQYVVHSSASLSAMTTIPHPPADSPPSQNGVGLSTLVACGEYRGRGSLELYSLPHIKQPGGQQQHQRQLAIPSASETAASTPSADSDLDTSKPSVASPAEPPFSYKNRQDAAKSKLLSVASHGTRIVFSDSEGGLKWVERDGHGLVRRWNINTYEAGSGSRGGVPMSGGITSASVSGDLVARKIMPLAPNQVSSDHGQSGDSDLLIWTGERVGVVSTDARFVDHEEMVRHLEGDGDAHEERVRQKNEEEQYSKIMRRALERQADERRWMSRFRLKFR